MSPAIPAVTNSGRSRRMHQHGPPIPPANRELKIALLNGFLWAMENLLRRRLVLSKSDDRVYIARSPGWNDHGTECDHDQNRGHGEERSGIRRAYVE